MIYEIERGRRGFLSPLFPSPGDTVVPSVLQGHFGRAFCDDPENPRAGRLTGGDFSFLGGDASLPAAEELIQGLPPEHIVVPMGATGEAWLSLLEKAYAGRCRRIQRYHVRPPAGGFDVPRLEALAASLPQGYACRQILGGLTKTVLASEWSRDACGNFDSPEDYDRRGLGYCVVNPEGKPVAVCSSFSVYDEGLEIEVDTHPDWRRRGFATVCSAALVLGCLRRGMHPNWDAANLHSVELSKKLGYVFAGAYEACRIL